MHLAALTQTIEQARRKAIDILATIAGGDNPAEAKRKIRDEMVFSEMFDEYMERHAKVNKRSWDQDLQNFNFHLRDQLGNKKLSSIDRRDVRAIHERLTKRGTRTAANRVLALISIIYAKAIEREYATVSPAAGIKLNKEQSRDRFLQADELPRFFESLAAEENEKMRDFFLLALLTGARRRAVAAMHWRDISLERAEWRIQLTKNGLPQTVHLSPEAINILTNRKLTSVSIFVFPAKSKTGYVVEPKDAWRRILDRDELAQLTKRIKEVNIEFEQDTTALLSQNLREAHELADKMKINRNGARMQDLHIHDLRRTLGSWQAAGASLSVIGKSLNHSSVSTTAIYARLNLDPVRESVNRATANMFATLGETQNLLQFRKS